MLGVRSVSEEVCFLPCIKSWCRYTYSFNIVLFIERGFPLLAEGFFLVIEERGVLE